MFSCQQHLIKRDSEMLAILEYLCRQSNNIFNCATYYARQIYFKTGKILKRGSLNKAMVGNPHFGSMYVSSSQQTVNAVAESFESFRKLKKKYNKGEMSQRPRPPKYRKSGGLFTVSYPKRWLRLKDGQIRVPLGRQVKVWFGIDHFYLPMPTNLEFDQIKEIRFLPRNGCFYAEFITQQPDPEPVKIDPDRALAIDPGINNWLTCVGSHGDSFIVDGRQIKSKNQWYNKRVSILKDGKRKGFWSKQLSAITEKRNRQMRDAVNKAARIVINHCLKHGVGTVVFGWNDGQRQSVNLGKKTNQTFVGIPTARLKNRIAQLCEQYGIQFVETEEAYTSKASFLDDDLVPTYGEKPKEYKPSGRRVKRGLYKSNLGYLVNADAQAAANILRKVATSLGINLERVSRGVLTSPSRVRFWATCQ